MANIIFPQRWTQKPKSVYFNFGHPLAAQIADVYLLSEGGGNTQGMMNRNLGTLSGTTIPTWQHADQGANLKFAGGASLASYVNAGTTPFVQDLFDGTTHPGSIVARCMPTSASTAGGITERNDNNVSVGWEFGLTNSGLLFLSMVLPTTDTKAHSTKAVTANKWATFAVSHDGSLTAANIRFYFDGQKDTTVTGTNGSGTQTSDSAQSLYIGNAQYNYTSPLGGSGSFPGSIEFVYFWKRILSAAEMEWLAVEPYAMFMPQAPHVRYFIAPVTAGTSKSAADGFKVFWMG